MKRIIAAFFHSLAGLHHGFVNETAIRQEIILFLFSLPVVPFIANDIWHMILLWSVILVILLAELLNTGIEKLADRITTDYSEEVKIAKDCGSAAVLIPSLIAGVVWIVSLYEFLIG